LLINAQIRLLRLLSREGRPSNELAAYRFQSKLSACLSSDLLKLIAGKTVIDFGCGEGGAAIELVRHGARHVIGIEIQESHLRVARERARQAGVEHTCTFTQTTNQRADLIISLDAFEHFADPAAILRAMDSLLKSDGEIMASFGPTWYHPAGGHLFSIFPWAHLIFSEEALLRWRSGFRNDGATRFGEVAGGLNQITIRQFEDIIAESPFRIAALELIPIRKLRWLHNRVTREFTTAVVRCRLAKRVAEPRVMAAAV
jgi:SAM-dependent methyltransferase